MNFMLKNKVNLRFQTFQIDLDININMLAKCWMQYEYPEREDMHSFSVFCRMGQFWSWEKSLKKEKFYSQKQPMSWLDMNWNEYLTSFKRDKIIPRSLLTLEPLPQFDLKTGPVCVLVCTDRKWNRLCIKSIQIFWIAIYGWCRNPKTLPSSQFLEWLSSPIRRLIHVVFPFSRSFRKWVWGIILIRCWL